MAFPAYGPVFDKITLVKFIRKIYLYFSIGNSQPGNQHCATAASAHTRVPCWAFCDPYIHSEKCRRYFHAVLVNTVQRGQFHRCKKRFLRFLFFVTFSRFLTFFIFQTFFIFKKRWQSSERQAD